MKILGSLKMIICKQFDTASSIEVYEVTFANKEYSKEKRKADTRFHQVSSYAAI